MKHGLCKVIGSWQEWWGWAVSGCDDVTAPPTQHHPHHHHPQASRPPPTNATPSSNPSAHATQGKQYSNWRTSAFWRHAVCSRHGAEPGTDWGTCE